MHFYKKGIRVLGIAESFRKGISKNSILTGVVMRADMILDGFAFSMVEVGGMDATEKIMDMLFSLDREDVNLLLLNGSVISWYNIIDLKQIVERLELPLISVSYEASEGLDKYIKENFPDDWENRIEIYRKNGKRQRIDLATGYSIYVRFLGLDKKETLYLLNKLTIHGRIPEPLRIAKLIARSLLKSFPAIT